MMEFLLSKVWAAIFGLALVSIVMVSFQGLDAGTEQDLVDNGVKDLIDTLDDIRDMGPGSSFDIDMGAFLTDTGMMEISGWTILSRLGEREALVHLDIPMVLMTNGELVSDFMIQVWPTSTMCIEVIEGSTLAIHLENSPTIFSTHSTNL